MLLGKFNCFLLGNALSKSAFLTIARNASVAVSGAYAKSLAAPVIKISPKHH
jgi:hypothetical protein